MHSCHRATGVPEAHAPAAWLAGFGEPPLLGLARALAHAGVEPSQISRLARLYVANLADQGGPEGMVQAVATRRWRLGDWQSAVAALVREGRL